MAFLKRDDPVVVDTHVLAEAARQERDSDTCLELVFVEALIQRCPRVVLSPDQVDRGGGRGELAVALRRRGFRFPEQSTLINKLDADGKLIRLPRSALGNLSAPAQAAFRGDGGHDNVTDDKHLYVTAIARQTVVVTRDEHLLRRATELAKHTGTETLDPAAVLERWSSEQ